MRVKAPKSRVAAPLDLLQRNIVNFFHYVRPPANKDCYRKIKIWRGKGASTIFIDPPAYPLK
jgi:hypothetical protein